MKYLYLIILFNLALSLSTRANLHDPFYGATTTRPAQKWEEAFLSGNGTLGAMVFGNPYRETVVLNHGKLYLPKGSREIVHDLADSMPAFKEAGLAAGLNGPAVVHQMMLEKSGQKIINTDPFHPACLLKLDVPDAPSVPENYRMTEDFENGEIKVQWSDEQGAWERKLFVSRPDQAVVMSISGPPGKVGCELSMEIKHDGVQPDIIAQADSLAAHVVYTEGKGGYDVLIRIIPEGGQARGEDGQVTVTGADRILLLMQVKTWRSPLPAAQSEAWAYSPEHPDFGPGYLTNELPAMREALARLPADYGALLAPHARVHGDLFGRVKLDVYEGPDRWESSEILMARAVERDHMSLALMERMYDACRYLTICSTGERPANLQGIWSGSWKPAWSGDYTLDSNLQLEVQSLMSSHMPELMESYFNLVESWLPDCRTNARKLYGCRGIVSNARASNTCLLLHWGKWPGEQLISCMGWMAHFFYDYYQFTGDKTFLAERVVPLLKETALFYEDLLAGTEDEQGTYRFFLGYSPEHRLLANPTFDVAVARAVLTYLIKSCHTLGIEQENVPGWEAMLARMPAYLVNADGELQEWAWPGAPEDYNQRHHSHLLPLYQFCEFDPERTPELWQASEKAFERKVQEWLRREKGSNSNHITHGMMNQGQCAARLGRGDVVEEVLSRMATRRYLYPSFMISYWPDLKGFGFDPVGTLPDVVHNSLVFAWEGVLDLLPALPEAWPKGSIRGVLARGQIQVDKLAWDRPEGRIDLTLTSAIAQDIKLRLPRGVTIQSMEVVEGDAVVEAGDRASRTAPVSLSAGQTCRIKIAFRDR